MLRKQAQEDPELFLEHHPAPCTIDEIQYAPLLLSYLKIRIDARRDQPGQFLLTGSQQFSLMQGVTESLAGRVAVLDLLPLSMEEQPEFPLSSLAAADRWIRGAFPELIARPELDLGLWYSSYVQTYLERDVRALRQVGDLGEYQRFLEMAAARNAQLMDLTALSRDLGLSVNTIKAWIRVLEASFQVHLLYPYFRNQGKRLVKTPKFYFNETGLLCYLLGLRDAAHTLQGPAAGGVMEAAVWGEIFKAFSNAGEQPRAYFWRTTRGEEIDFVIEWKGRLLPIEVKLTKTPGSALARPLEDFCDLFPSESPEGVVVCWVERPVTLSRRCRAIPFRELPSILQ